MEILENFKQDISSGFVIVDFYAPWCGDCTRIEPALKELEKDYKIHKVNIDGAEYLASEYAIKRIPTLVFFKDGKEVGTRLIEPRSKQQIIDEINKLK